MKEQLHSLMFTLRNTHGERIPYSCSAISNFIYKFNDLVNDYNEKNDCLFHSLYKKTVCVLFDKRLKSIEQLSAILQSSISLGFTTKVIIDVHSYIQISKLKPEILLYIRNLHLFSLEDKIDEWFCAFEISLLYNCSVTFIGNPSYFLNNKLLARTHLKMNNCRVTSVKETIEKVAGTIIIDELGIEKSVCLNDSSNKKISNLFRSE